MILRHIDATVIGRRLTLTFDDGALLLCDATGRRLIRLLPPIPKGLYPEQTTLFDGEDLRRERAQLLAAMLMQLCEKRNSVRITAEPLATDLDPAEGGIAPATVAALLGVQDPVATGSSRPDILERFVAALGPRLRCAVVLSGEEFIHVVGEEAEVAALADWAADTADVLLGPDFPMAPALESDGVLALAPTPGASCHTVIAGRLGQVLIATIEGHDPGKTLDQWRACRCGDVRVNDTSAL